MLFSSIPFLYYFLPMVLVVYFLAPRKAKNTVLLVSSLIFYGWGEPKLLFLMVFTIVLFYFCGLAIGARPSARWKKAWLLVSVVISLALLGIFKYADFFIGSFNTLTGLSIPLLVQFFESKANGETLADSIDELVEVGKFSTMEITL